LASRSLRVLAVRVLSPSCPGRAVPPLPYAQVQAQASGLERGPPRVQALPAADDGAPLACDRLPACPAPRARRLARGGEGVQAPRGPAGRALLRLSRGSRDVGTNGDVGPAAGREHRGVARARVTSCAAVEQA